MEQNNKHENGFLYILIKWICGKLYYLNVVEYFKEVVWWIASSRLFKVTKTVANKRKIKSNAIDIYKLIKLGIILYFWIFNINERWASVVIFYFIITTLMTYLKYHFWNKNTSDNFERSRRRFISMIMSFTFIIISYAYLYDVPYEYAIAKDSVTAIHLTVVQNIEGVNWNEAILYSLSNAFGGNYSSIIAVDKVGDWLSISQIIITFIYISIIFAKSLFG